MDVQVVYSPAPGPGGGSPSATLIHSSENLNFTTSFNFSVGALSAGDYVLFTTIKQSSITFTSATLEGSAMTKFTNGATDQGALRMQAFYINSLAGGGNETLNVVINSSSGGVSATLIKVDDGTIVTTAVTDNQGVDPPDLSFTFANAADELMLVGWIHDNNVSPFSSYTNLTALQVATNADELCYGVGSGSASGGTPDTAGVNFIAGFYGACGIGVQVT